MRRFVSVLVVALAATACSSGSGGGGGAGGDAGGAATVQLMPGFDPGPAPDPSQGFQIITPIVTDIEPGASDEYCTWTDITLPQDTWVSASEGFQTETGHHIIVYYAPSHQPVGTHLCGNSEMSEFNFGMPGNSTGTKFQLPGNLAVKLPAGSQLVVNHHYLNASSSAVAQAQSAINIYYADPNVAHTTSSTMVVLDTSLSVPTGSSSYGVDCTINQPYSAWMMLPHMHAWGTHVTITYTPAATGTSQQLFDMDWDPSYAFDVSGIATTKDPSAPFTFAAGDKVHIQCDYMNTTSGPLTFGDEMCVFATFTVDPTNVGNMECDKGQWGPF